MKKWRNDRGIKMTTIELIQEERYFIGSLIDDYHKTTENIDELTICETIFEKLKLSCFLTSKEE